MTIAVARVPTKPPTWSLTSPCGECRGCVARDRVRRALEIVEEDLLESARVLDPTRMSYSEFFERADAIERRRRSLRELFDNDHRGSQCENMEIVAT